MWNEEHKVQMSHHLLCRPCPLAKSWLEEFLLIQWHDDCWHQWSSNASEQLPSSPIERYWLSLQGLTLHRAHGAAMEMTKGPQLFHACPEPPHHFGDLTWYTENNPYAALIFNSTTCRELTSKLGSLKLFRDFIKSWLYKTPLKYSHQMFAMHITLGLYVVRWISIISCFSHLQRWLFQLCPDVAEWAEVCACEQQTRVIGRWWLKRWWKRTMKE